MKYEEMITSIKVVHITFGSGIPPLAAHVGTDIYHRRPTVLNYDLHY